MSGAPCPDCLTTPGRNQTGSADCGACVGTASNFQKYERAVQRQREYIGHANTEITDPQFLRWKRENTKPCPGCQTAIEKNGGCKHMTCPIDTCKTEFCWDCFGPYKSGAFYCIPCTECNGTGNTGFPCDRCAAMGRTQIRGPFPGGCGYRSDGTTCVKGKAGVIPDPATARPAPVQRQASWYSMPSNY